MDHKLIYKDEEVEALANNCKIGCTAGCGIVCVASCIATGGAVLG